ncbi:right-handed parallel beta-helix repeat-containing protein [Pedobacter antarcticus]|uniref:right-handed parallel beta-helix repeat-containing protein n=1 Tax=Pedobacter antarcticus TaxID=34086 RepID=UPI00292F9001|nr:right-handed parallel beta-helix repeat-containing protein [Pedobacter antarcticus]
MKYLITATLLFLMNNCYSQLGSNFKYSQIPSDYLGTSTSYQNIDLGADFVDLTTLLPQGYVKDGSIDYTDVLQQGLNNNRKVIMPNFSVLINDKGLLLKSNSIVFFKNNSKIIMAPSDRGADSKDHYDILRINNVENVTVYNCVLVGDRKNHKNNIGEWGMGIGIRSSKNVSIINANVSNCWGDGIYLGTTKRKLNKTDRTYIPTENITIKYARVDYNRRNGISITNGKDVTVSKCLVSNTSGTLPMSGLDIEPNSSLDVISNITIDNLITYRNSQDGLLIVLTKLPSQDFNNTVGININNHIDDGSYSAMRLGSGFRKADMRMSGSINVNNSKWKNCNWGLRFRSGYGTLPSVNFTNLTVNGSKVSSFAKTGKDIYNNGKTLQSIKQGLKLESNIQFK